MKICLDAPAKINWFLSVIGKRKDGYHDIVSCMQFISLYDSLSFEDSDDISLISDLDIPVTQNLVYKAASLLKEVSSYKRGAVITLKKDIPVAAGLGGGSTDAAFTLIGLNKLWDLNLDKSGLMDLAAKIGSDVPFFLDGPFSLVEGRGEKVTPLEDASSVSLLLVRPDIPVSAEWAYRSLRTELTKKHIDIKLFCQSLAGQDFTSLRQHVLNDLESTVVKKHRQVAEIREMLVQSGAVVVCMSGSGPTVFGVFKSEEDAHRVSLNMRKYWYRVVKTLK